MPRSPDRRWVVSGRPARPSRRDRRPAVATVARRLPRRRRRVDDRRAAGQDDRHDRRRRQPRRRGAVVPRGRRRHPHDDIRRRHGHARAAPRDPPRASPLAGDADRRRRGDHRLRGRRHGRSWCRHRRPGADRAADARHPRRDVGAVPDVAPRRAGDRCDRVQRQHAGRPRLPGAGRRRRRADQRGGRSAAGAARPQRGACRHRPDEWLPGVLVRLAHRPGDRRRRRAPSSTRSSPRRSWSSCCSWPGR